MEEKRLDDYSDQGDFEVEIQETDGSRSVTITG